MKVAFLSAGLLLKSYFERSERELFFDGSLIIYLPVVFIAWLMSIIDVNCPQWRKLNSYYIFVKLKFQFLWNFFPKRLK